MTYFKEFVRKGSRLILGKNVFSFPGVDPLSSKDYLPTSFSYGILVKNDNDIEAIKRAFLPYKEIIKVKSRENVYWGPHVKRAPHLTILLDHDKGYKLGSNRISPTVTAIEQQVGHHPHGILSFIGKDVTSSDLGLIKAWNVAPTIMAYMGVPIPHDVDGKILSNIFNVKTRKIRHYNYTSRWRTIKKVDMIKIFLNEQTKL